MKKAAILSKEQSGTMSNRLLTKKSTIDIMENKSQAKSVKKDKTLPALKLTRPLDLNNPSGFSPPKALTTKNSTKREFLLTVDLLNNASMLDS